MCRRLGRSEMYNHLKVAIRQDNEVVSILQTLQIFDRTAMDVAMESKDSSASLSNSLAAKIELPNSPAVWGKTKLWKRMAKLYQPVKDEVKDEVDGDSDEVKAIKRAAPIPYWKLYRFGYRS